MAQVRHPRIDIVAACRARESLDGATVERVASDDGVEFWGHYVVGPDGRQIWEADFDSLADAVAAAKQGGARRVFLDDGGRLLLIR